MKNNILSIGKTLAVDEFTNIIIQTSKIASSTRSISLDSETVKIMSKWRTIQNTDYLEWDSILQASINSFYEYKK